MGVLYKVCGECLQILGSRRLGFCDLYYSTWYTGEMNPERLRFVFINGKGSSGKDTQAEILRTNAESIVRISTGDIYRGARTPDGEYGRFHEQIRPFMEAVGAGGY